MTDKTLKPCPFCHQPVQFRKALHIEDGNVDSIIHAAPSDCPMVVFEDGSVDESILSKWNTRAQSDVRATEPKSEPVAFNLATGERDNEEADPTYFHAEARCPADLVEVLASLRAQLAMSQSAVDFCGWLNGYFGGISRRDELTASEANTIRAQLYRMVYPPTALSDDLRGK